MEQTQNNAEALLRLEEPFAPKDVKWLVAATTRDGRKGRVTPYADPRAYTDRLNEVVTASGWTRQYAVHTVSPVFRLKKDKTIQTGRCSDLPTIHVMGSHSGSGEEWADENAMTSAEANLGGPVAVLVSALLYDFAEMWVELTKNSRKVFRPAIWAAKGPCKQPILSEIEGEARPPPCAKVLSMRVLPRRLSFRRELGDTLFRSILAMARPFCGRFKSACNRTY